LADLASPVEYFSKTTLKKINGRTIFERPFVYHSANKNLLLRHHGCKLGKQLHRLPNSRINAIADVGLDERSPTSYAT
jgi:hypothetical protein